MQKKILTAYLATDERLFTAYTFNNGEYTAYQTKEQAKTARKNAFGDMYKTSAELEKHVPIFQAVFCGDDSTGFDEIDCKIDNVGYMMAQVVKYENELRENMEYDPQTKILGFKDKDQNVYSVIPKYVLIPSNNTPEGLPDEITPTQIDDLSLLKYYHQNGVWVYQKIGNFQSKRLSEPMANLYEYRNLFYTN